MVCRAVLAPAIRFHAGVKFESETTFVYFESLMSLRFSQWTLKRVTSLQWHTSVTRIQVKWLQHRKGIDLMPIQHRRVICTVGGTEAATGGEGKGEIEVTREEEEDVGGEVSVVRRVVDTGIEKLGARNGGL